MQTARLGPELLLVHFIWCKGDHRPGAFPQSPARSCPKEFLSQNWDTSSPGAFWRIHMWWGRQVTAHRVLGTHLCILIQTQFTEILFALKVYLNFSYLNNFFSYLCRESCSHANVLLQNTTQPCWSDLRSSGLRKEKEKCDQACLVKVAEVIYPYSEFSEPRGSTFQGTKSIISLQISGLKRNAFLKSNNFYVLTR